MHSLSIAVLFLCALFCLANALPTSILTREDRISITFDKNRSGNRDDILATTNINSMADPTGSIRTGNSEPRFFITGLPRDDWDREFIITKHYFRNRNDVPNASTLLWAKRRYRYNPATRELSAPSEETMVNNSGVISDKPLYVFQLFLMPADGFTKEPKEPAGDLLEDRGFSSGRLFRFLSDNGINGDERKPVAGAYACFNFARDSVCL
ncbi:hypothetical protein L873DRAFT_1797718 [Choiromyces venosus 120613-1]|uniref:Uncharacterized protein n=1 Tax=Choiromyces venosus 120613-1 TaxID=1336337 RepID=A0A3N4K4T4_9PEZI|nr:hypothetical protein L873DRAFT_1797718 [Choiromyces venosus 120613-1]